MLKIWGYILLNQKLKFLMIRLHTYTFEFHSSNSFKSSKLEPIGQYKR